MSGTNLLNVILALAASLSTTSGASVNPSNIQVTAIYYIVNVPASALGRRRLLVCTNPQSGRFHVCPFS